MKMNRRWFAPWLIAALLVLASSAAHGQSGATLSQMEQGRSVAGTAPQPGLDIADVERLAFMWRWVDHAELVSYLLLILATLALGRLAWWLRSRRKIRWQAAVLACVGLTLGAIDLSQSLRFDLFGRWRVSTRYVVNIMNAPFNAIPDDGLDDRAAWQAGVDSVNARGGGIVYAPHGIYELASCTLRQGGGAIDIDNMSNVTIMGAGAEATILRWKAGTDLQALGCQDPHMFQFKNSRHITLTQFTIDGNQNNITNTNEQSHGIEVQTGTGEPVEHITYTRMMCIAFKGDCIRLLGGPPGYLVRHWDISFSVFDGRDRNGVNRSRSGVGAQRGTYDIRIHHNAFLGGTDQLIDFEPTGCTTQTTGISNAPWRWNIHDNFFKRPGGPGKLMITLSGTGGCPVRDLQFTSNYVEGTIDIADGGNALIQGNTIVNDTAQMAVAEVDTVNRAIDVLKNSTGMRILDNDIVNCPGGPTLNRGSIQFAQQSNSPPTNIEVSRNRIRQCEPTAVIRFEGIGPGPFKVLWNDIDGMGAADMGVHMRQTKWAGAAVVRGVSICGNTFRNLNTASNAVITLKTDSAQATPFEDVLLCNNMFTDDQVTPTQTVALRFDKNASGTAAQAFPRLIIAVNMFGRGITTTTSGSAATGLVWSITNGGFGGAGRILSGVGDPEGAVTGWVSDLYLRRDGSPGMAKCVKESGNNTNVGWACS